MVDVGELVRTVSALFGTLAVLMTAFVWLVDSMLGKRLAPVLQAVEALNHAHAETRRRVEHLETRVERLKDDKLDRGEADARIELALSRVRTGDQHATK